MKYERHFEPDLKECPIVVIESDDWCACEVLPNKEKVDEYKRILAESESTAFYSSRLETPADLQRLFKLLASHAGADGVPPVFTAFTCTGNPDFKAIEDSGFTLYKDIPICEGFPPDWNGEGILDAMRAGIDQGVWCPEYHAMLHHTSPRLWLELLREQSKDGDLARKLFALGTYYQGKHLPEFHGYTIAEQLDFIVTGFERFRQAFGRYPAAAITSDAFPETELLWQAMGCVAVSLKNCRVNSGDVVVYYNKPWNMQDVYAHIGDCRPMADCAYLTRNVFCEVGTPLEEVRRTIHNAHRFYKEPAIISMHRNNYCSLNEARDEANYDRLETLLQTLDNEGACYLTSAELASLYVRGWSARRIGQRQLFRRWKGDAKVPACADGLAPGAHWLPLEADMTLKKDYQLY